MIVCELFPFLCVLQLLTSVAVHKWGGEIQEGIFNMLTLLVELVAVRLGHQPLSITLLDTLSLVNEAYVIMNTRCEVSILLNTLSDVSKAFDI